MKIKDVLHVLPDYCFVTISFDERNYFWKGLIRDIPRAHLNQPFIVAHIFDDNLYIET